RRWISWVRPLCLPLAASRALRVWVARGSMPYSAVTQPWPLPRRKPGTFSSTLAVHSTRVAPNSTSTEPSAWQVKPRVRRTARSWSGWRWLGRMGEVLSIRVKLADGGVDFADGALDLVLVEFGRRPRARARHVEPGGEVVEFHRVGGDRIGAGRAR